ncbi:MAG: CYTH domain-containing protein [Gammaproteobacteria bacterium]
MAVEIERKFRVADDAWREAVNGSPMHYRQGYLALSERAVVRVRLSGENRAWLCVKERKVGASRGEYEYPISDEDAHELLDLAVGTVIEKRRHLVAHAGHTWEVDEFLGANAGLVVAEIELASEEEPFARPRWLGAEVTGEERYYNAALALHPWSEWHSDTEEGE